MGGQKVNFSLTFINSFEGHRAGRNYVRIKPYNVWVQCESGVNSISTSALEKEFSQFHEIIHQLTEYK